AAGAGEPRPPGLSDALAGAGGGRKATAAEAYPVDTSDSSDASASSKALSARAGAARLHESMLSTAGPPKKNRPDQPAGRALATTTVSSTGLPGSERTATKAVSELARPQSS